MVSRIRHVRILALAVLFFLPLVGDGPPAFAAELTPPAGYAVTSADALHAGVRHVSLVNYDVPQRVHVAAIDPGAGVRVVPVLSGDRVAGPSPRLERTSSMCGRVDCIVAVNADFFHPSREVPVGGFATGGELMRSPVPTHHQLYFGRDGRGAAGVVSASVKVVSTDLAEMATPHLNVARGPDALVVYTPAFGPSTATNPHGAELVVRLIRPAGSLRIGQTSLAELTVLRDGAGDSPIPDDGLVLSGHGAAADTLRQLWQRLDRGEVAPQVLVRVETSPSLVDTVGGAPVLVRDGKRFVADDGSVFASGRHPRTMVGWRADGTLLLVTADGRQPAHAAGLSLPEAADLMVALGAVEAINLDGGGSTTFVVRGEVRNSPSDQLVGRGRFQKVVSLLGNSETSLGAVERPTVSALAVVAADAPAPPRPDVLVDDVQLPETIDTRGAVAADPASDVAGRLPAVVGAVEPNMHAAPSLAPVAAALNAGVVLATVRAWRRRRALAA